TMDNFVFTMNITTFTHKEKKGKLMMGTFKMNFGDPKQAQMQMKQSRGPMEAEIRDSVDIKNTEQREIMINGQKVSLAIGEGTDRATGKGVHTVSADFDEPGGMKFFSLKMDDDIWDEDAVIKTLEEAK